MRKHYRYIRAAFGLLLSLSAISIGSQPQQTAPSKRNSASPSEGDLSEGMNQLRQHNLDAAQASFEKVLKVSPSNAAAHNLLGWVLLAKGQLDPAISHFRSALHINPSLAQAHMNLSVALLQKNDVPAAVREAREAARLAPKDAEAPRTPGRALSFANQPDEASHGKDFDRAYCRAAVSAASIHAHVSGNHV